ncbi:MAG: hypothetical protein ACLGSD_17265 [Acidobacteriota bacterium]
MKLLIEELIDETGLQPDVLGLVVTRTLRHLHRGFHERAGQNGDYVGGQSSLDVGQEGYLHLLGMLICFAEDYVIDEPGEFLEYGDRIVPRSIHEQVIAEMETWRKREPR